MSLTKKREDETDGRAESGVVQPQKLEKSQRSLANAATRRLGHSKAVAKCTGKRSRRAREHSMDPRPGRTGLRSETASGTVSAMRFTGDACVPSGSSAADAPGTTVVRLDSAWPGHV